MHSGAAPRSQVGFALPDEAATARLGACVARAIQALTDPIEQAGLVITLSGELGSGKTALVRSVLRQLGVTGAVRSPTFSLLELYSVSKLNFYHFDFYRFSKTNEFASTGFRDFFGPASVCAIEWPERVREQSFKVDLRIGLQFADAGRVAQLDAFTPLGQRCLEALSQAWKTNPDVAC